MPVRCAFECACLFYVTVLGEQEVSSQPILLMSVWQLFMFLLCSILHLIYDSQFTATTVIVVYFGEKPGKERKKAEITSTSYR